MLGKVFKKNGINLVYGASGIGKTVSTVKSLNEEGIVPILLDFDGNESPKENGCDYIHVDGVLYLRDTGSVIPTDTVIIIDTWQMLLTNTGSIKDVFAMRDAGNTIIVIAHNKDIATRQDIPDMDNKFYNHFDSKLFLEYDKGSSTKSNPRAASYNLTVMKLRGYKGKRTLINWMRSVNEQHNC